MSVQTNEGLVLDDLVGVLDAGNTQRGVNMGLKKLYNLAYGFTEANLVNGPSYDTGNGGAINLDGVDDSIETTLTANTIFQSPFSLSIWFNQRNSTNTSFPRVWEKSSSSTTTASGFTMFFYDSAATGQSLVYYKIGNNVIGPVSGMKVDTGQWINMVSVFNNSQITTYLNTTRVITSHTQLLSSITTTNPFTIGNTTAFDRPFEGLIANAYVYDRELTQAEVNQNYNQLKHRYL